MGTHELESGQNETAVQRELSRLPRDELFDGKRLSSDLQNTNKGRAQDDPCPSRAGRRLTFRIAFGTPSMALTIFSRLRPASIDAAA